MGSVSNSVAFQSRTGWRGNAFDKARASTPVRLSIHHVDDLPGYHEIRFAPRPSPTYHSAVMARKRFIRAAMAEDFGDPYLMDDEWVTAVATKTRACVRSNAMVTMASNHPLDVLTVNRPATHAFILLERRNISPAQDVAESTGLHPSQCKNEYGINITRSVLDHELHHVILRETPGRTFLRKFDEYHSDTGMTLGAHERHDVPTARYGLEWRLLSNACSDVSNESALYFNSLSLAANGPRDPVRELAATMEMKSAIFCMNQWRAYHPPSVNDLKVYINDCLTAPQEKDMRNYYSRQNPARAMNILLTAQHLQGQRFMLPETAELMEMTASAARNRVHLRPVT